MYAGDRAVVNTTGQALDICDRLGDDGLGVALDVYHVWWDPEIEAQIRRAGRERLLAFHVCDWLVPTADLLEDRGMMGDGVIDIRGLRTMVEAQGYDGCHEVEIFSRENWWRRDPAEVLRVCVERHAACC
jgi:sugar phosphate isomerase/epimerase